MKIKFSLLLILSFILSSISLSQVSYEKRIEFELKDGYDTDNIIPKGKDGFIMISENQKPDGKDREWLYEFYDNNLESEKREQIYLDKKMASDVSFESQKGVYSLFRNNKGEIEIVTVLHHDGSIKSTKGKLHKKFYPKSMVVVDQFAYIKGILKKSPAIMVVNLSTGMTGILPVSIGSYKLKNISYKNMQANTSANEVYLFVQGINSKKSSEMFFLVLTDGKIKTPAQKIDKTNDFNIISISASKINDAEYIITGTYGEKSNYASVGLFFGKIENKKVDFLKFFNFLEFKDFLTYLPEKRQAKIERKKERKKKQGKEMTIDYNIASHNIIKTPEGNYIFLGEAFYPTYRTETYTTFVNGQSVTQTRQVFDGYQYTHAMISKFSPKGELIWDRLFKMYASYKPFYIKRFITLYGDSENSLNMAFVDSKKINTKSINYINGEILKEENSDEIETGWEGDETKKGITHMEYWYENYFIVYGNQVIKNKGDDKNKKGKRKVFFVSKVAYQK